MTEAERRKITVETQPKDIVGETLYIKKADYPPPGFYPPGITGVWHHGFGLFDSADKLIAWSRSDHALSDWAFKLPRVFNIKHDYNLAEGDDGR